MNDLSLSAHIPLVMKILSLRNLIENGFKHVPGEDFRNIREGLEKEHMKTKSIRCL